MSVYEAQDLKIQLSSNIEHFNTRQDAFSGIDPGINSFGACSEHSYVYIFSLNLPGETDMHTSSGLDSEQVTATVECKVVGEAFTPKCYHVNSANHCTPYLAAPDLMSGMMKLKS
jgi:hypothetical protein